MVPRADAMEQYRIEWQGPAHTKTIRRLEKVDPEFLYEAEEALLPDSPLSSSPWDQLRRIVAELRGSLTPRLRDAFDLGSRISRELHPSMSAGDEVTRLGRRLADEVAGLECIGREHFAAESEWDRAERAGQLLEMIPTSFSSVPATSIVVGHLDIEMNEATNTIRRGDRRIKLTWPLLWQLAIRLVRANGTTCSRRILEGVWPAGRTVTANSFERAMSDLNKWLKRRIDQRLCGALSIELRRDSQSK